MFGKKKRKLIATFVCPHCGSVIPAASPACPECGSDAETGWSENSWLADYMAPADEDQSVERRKQQLKRVFKITGSLIGALTIGAFLAVEIQFYGIYIGMGVMLAVIMALIVFRKRPPSAKKLEKSLEKELLVLSGRDPARLERLVMYEKSFKPDASRSELLKRAIDRLIRDRSR
jgi:hypothetical protein